jgi:toxin ParE1/3/4
LARVLQTPRALADLDEIWLFIASDSLSAADRWLDRLYDKARLLAEQPMLGRARPELLATLAPDLRSFSFRAYVLFYRPIEDGIELVRILNAARDIGQVFAVEE